MTTCEYCDAPKDADKSCAYCRPTGRDGWTPASVGCHWTRGEYSISTYQCGAESGYALYRHGAGEVGRYGSFEEAAKAAQRDNQMTNATNETLSHRLGWPKKETRDRWAAALTELGIQHELSSPTTPEASSAARAITDRVCDDGHPSLFAHHNDWGLRVSEPVAMAWQQAQEKARDVPAAERQALRRAALAALMPPAVEAAKAACETCEDIRTKHGGFGPSHDGSKMCESGSIASGGQIAHCSCDTCF